MVSRRDDRSQLIRAFDDWLEEAKPRFSFPPRVTHREGHELRMGFDGIHRLVVATLCGCGPERASIALERSIKGNAGPGSSNFRFIGNGTRRSGSRRLVGILGPREL